MPTANAGVFRIDYTLYTNAVPTYDIQFGMDFTITQTSAAPLSQVIFPATAVGTNIAGVWNVDNHKPNSSSCTCLIFAGADNGTIIDTPRELSRWNEGIRTTKFSVYRLEVSKNALEIHGVTFGYTINTGAATPQTTFTEFRTMDVSNEQKAVLLAKCSALKFV